MKYEPPSFEASAFNCPHCNAYAHQEWDLVGRVNRYSGRPPHIRVKDNYEIRDMRLCTCAKCKNYSLWVNRGMVYPKMSNAPLPIEDMPKDVKEDFIEARNIFNEPPRGAVALLRLALEKLMPHIGGKGKNLNKDIKYLVKEKGLPVKIQQALDSLRVIGSQAVHPLDLDLKKDSETVSALFEILNIIVDEMIVKPKKLSEVYKKLPKSKRKAIKDRDQ